MTTLGRGCSAWMSTHETQSIRTSVKVRRNVIGYSIEIVIKRVIKRTRNANSKKDTQCHVVCGQASDAIFAGFHAVSARVGQPRIVATPYLAIPCRQMSSCNADCIACPLFLSCNADCIVITLHVPCFSLCSGGPNKGKFITIGMPPKDYPNEEAAKKACCT